MDKKIKPSTIIRIVALALTVINQGFALFAKDYVGFASSLAYQIITIVLTIGVAGYCAWKNNDITKAARLAGAFFAALKDGKISTEEMANMLVILEEKTKTVNADGEEVAEPEVETAEKTEEEKK